MQSSYKGFFCEVATEPTRALRLSGVISMTSQRKAQPPRGHRIPHTFIWWLQLFSSQIIPELLVIGVWVLEILWTTCFSFSRLSENNCRNTKTFGKKGCSYSLVSQIANQEKWKYNKPVFLKSLAELLQQFLGFILDLKTGQSPRPNLSAFLALVLALYFNMQLSQAQQPGSAGSTQICNSE